MDYQPRYEPDLAIGAQVLPWLLKPQSFVIRRVDLVRWLTAKSVRIQTQIELALPDAEPRLAPSLAVFARTAKDADPAIGLDVLDEAGCPVPLLTQQETAWTVWSALVVLAGLLCRTPVDREIRKGLREFVASRRDGLHWYLNSSEDAWRGLVDAIWGTVGDTSEVLRLRREISSLDASVHPDEFADLDRAMWATLGAAVRRTAANGGMSERTANQWGSLLGDKVFQGATVGLAQDRPLVALLPGEGPRRRLLTYTRIESVTRARRGLRTLMGWLPTPILWPLPQASGAQSFHFQLEVPEGLVFVRHRWRKVWLEGGVPRTRGEERQSEGSMYRLNVHNAADADVWVWLRARRGLLSLPAFLASLLAFAVLGFTSFHGLIHDGDPGAASTILIAVPAVIAAIVSRPGDAPLLAELLAGVRAFVAMSAGVLFVAGIALLSLGPWKASHGLVWRGGTLVLGLLVLGLGASYWRTVRVLVLAPAWLAVWARLQRSGGAEFRAPFWSAVPIPGNLPNDLAGLWWIGAVLALGGYAWLAWRLAFPASGSPPEASYTDGDEQRMRP